jgi:hypothetical protein
MAQRKRWWSLARAIGGWSLVGSGLGCHAQASLGAAWSETDVGSDTTATTGDDEGDTTAGDGESSGGGSDHGSGEVIQPSAPPIYEPARYPGRRTHSPITPYVADRMREITLLGPDKLGDVFMKTGASSTVSRNTLFCFAEGPVDLGEHQHLDPTLQFFLGGDAAGTTPFDRESEAARVGRHSGWAISGDPSPIDIEVDMLSPRVALVHFGANDMGWGDTYGEALLYFHSNMMLLVDGLTLEGVVPVLFGITRRGDYASAQRWVDTWNATIRGIAQSRQVPYVDLYNAIDWLPGHGLAGDGLHLEAYSGGACILDEEGLQHGYNIRNRVALEVLDRAVAVLEDEVPGLDEPDPPLPGKGTPSAPWVIGALPFTNVHDTSVEGAPFIDLYPGCGSNADESGPELWYRLEVEETVRVRAAVLDMEGVDIDVHLLDESASGEGCIERGDHFVEATLEPGTYHFVLDTWVNGGGTPLAGEVLFVLVECADGDSSCN